MDSNDEFSIKNCMCCYFDDIIKIEDLILIKFYEMKKSRKTILVYDISYKTLIDAKPLRIDSIT